VLHLALLFLLAAPLDLSGSDLTDLTPYVHVYEDPTGSQNLRQVAQARFNAVPRLYFANANATYWVRFTLAGPHAPSLLTAGYRPYSVDYYVPAGHGGYRQFHSGDAVPYARRPVRDFNWIVFPLPQTPQPQTIYLRIRMIEPLVNLVAYSETRFAADNMRDIVVIVALLSILASLALSSIVLYFMMRDPLYLFYAAYIACQILYRANDFGLWQSTALQAASFPYVRTEVVFDGLTLVAATLFIRAFLRSHAHSRFFDRVNLAIACAGAAYMLLAAAGMPIRYTLVQNFSFVYVPVWIATGVVAWRRGYVPAKLFMFAWSALMAGIVLEAATDAGFFARFGIARESSLDVALDYTVYLGIAVESVLLCSRWRSRTARPYLKRTALRKPASPTCANWSRFANRPNTSSSSPIRIPSPGCRIAALSWTALTKSSG
jgi:hypothetical protein